MNGDANLNLNIFNPISLDQMDRVKLMNRTDTKFWFGRDKLQSLLYQVRDDYYILEINNRSILPYATTYFDTANNDMFITHHNGKLNRYKVRKRTYLSSNKSFLEVKFKSNKGRTIKSRITTDNHSADLTQSEDIFVDNIIPFSSSLLKPTLENHFSRIMLVSRAMDERCTIDINIQFKSEVQDVALDNLAVVELKTERNAKSSPLFKRLKESRIKSSGFSKYAIGRAVTDPALKQNQLKIKLRALERVSDYKV